MYCHKCGREIYAGEDFCKYCGTNFSDASYSKYKKHKAPSKQYMENEADNNSIRQQEKAAEQKKRKGRKTICSILAGVVLIILVVAGLFLFWLIKDKINYKKTDSQMMVGNQYINDGDYDTAASEFNEIISREQQNRYHYPSMHWRYEAYIGLSKAYFGLAKSGTDQEEIFQSYSLAMNPLLYILTQNLGDTSLHEDAKKMLDEICISQDEYVFSHATVGDAVPMGVAYLGGTNDFEINYHELGTAVDSSYHFIKWIVLEDKNGILLLTPIKPIYADNAWYTYDSSLDLAAVSEWPEDKINELTGNFIDQSFSASEKQLFEPFENGTIVNVWKYGDESDYEGGRISDAGEANTFRPLIRVRKSNF